MPQQSIRSFFATKTETNASNDDSEILPFRLPSKCKRVILESDESSCDDSFDVKSKPDFRTVDVNETDNVLHSPKKITRMDGNEIKESCLHTASKTDATSTTPLSTVERGSTSSTKFGTGSLQKSGVFSSESPNTSKSVAPANQDDFSGSVCRQAQVYDPSKMDYHPIRDANWSKGSSVPYLALAKTFEIIESTSGRLKIIESLSNFYRSVGVLSPNDLPTCIYLCLNQLGPAYEGVELGVGETVLLKALGMTTGVGVDHLKSALKRQGDLGSLAESIRSRQKTMFTPKPLTVSAVFSKLKEISLMTGNAAQAKKVERICSLLVACRECEAKYLIRSLSGKLRIGLAEQSVLTALGQAVALTPFHSIASLKDVENCTLLNASAGLSSDTWKNRMDACVANVKRAYCLSPNYETLVAGLLADGPDGLHLHCFITPGVPVKPMLAHPTHGVMDVLKRFDDSDFTCEYKYDGERAQIHILNPTTCHVYSRNQENNTKKYPDIVRNLMPRVIESSILTDTAKKYLVKISPTATMSSVVSCILDSEVVAWDRQAGHILPFQILSTRKRKDVDEANVKVQICVYAFDLLYLNGVSLLEQPLRVRREILREVFPQFHGEFMLASSIDSSDTDEIAAFLDESIKGNCEGLMVKTLDRNSAYEIARRSHNWLKLKKDYLDNVGDTLDLVVIGGFHGTGKRTGRYGGFLLACYDDNTEEYQTICKIGTGMKDEDLINFSNFFKDHVVPNAKPYYRYDPSLVPDHWFEPVQVWEVKAADLSISPAHKAAAGLADPEKGISLRFPRFLRIRDDKKPEDATSSQQVYDMFRNQEQIKNREASGVPVCEDDLY